MTSALRRAWSWLPRAPIVHFLVIGALLQGFVRHVLPGDERPFLVVPAERLEALRAGWSERQGRAPSAAEEAELRRRAVDEELLFREALALGLERDDRTVRFRLVQNMRFLGYGDPDGGDDQELFRQALDLGLHRGDPVVRRYLIAKMRLAAKAPAEAEPALTDAELEAHLEQHRDRWLRPSEVRLSQVFLSAELRGDGLESDARRVLEGLRTADQPPDRAASLGDPFPLGFAIGWHTHDELARTYGVAIADAAASLEPGVWSEPVASTWGLHLVRVEERRPARLPELDAVRSQVLASIAEERRALRLRSFLDALARRHLVVFEDEVDRGAVRTASMDGREEVER